MCLSPEELGFEFAWAISNQLPSLPRQGKAMYRSIILDKLLEEERNV